ncbi:MAG: MFS superfamily sulfate permease-like transporter [Myxococcota bacterium]|jgi:MFS superfamily sulfate permease-like transporter
MSEDGPDRLESGVVANLKYDLPAGLVVFLVALPLCLGIALASRASGIPDANNVPLMAGIIAGVIGGLIVAPLSGSQLSVSGPAAGLTTLVAGGIATLGGFEQFLPAIVIAGGMQIVVGLLRGGVIANIFPVSVVEGMLAGIGIILILKQLPHALGRDVDYEGSLDFWMVGHQDDAFSQIEAAILTASPSVVFVSLACLVVLIVWRRPFIANKSWSKIVPGPLVAVLLGVGLNELYGLIAPGMQILGTEGHMVQLPVLGSPMATIKSLPSPDWSVMGNPKVWTVAATIAAVASLESLLSVEAVDKLDPFRRTSNTNRELLAQGVGNALSGLIGGLPVTAVIVRSSTNVYSGGRTRMSAVFHGILLVGLVLAVPFLLNRIPLAALAAVLLTVGYKLSRYQLYKKMYKAGADQFVPFIVTVLLTVFVDLLTGVMVGLVIGVVMVLITNFQSAISVVNDGNAWLIRFTANVSFMSKTKLRNVLAKIPNNSEVVIDGVAASHIDHDILAIIEDFVESARFRDITVQTRRLESKDHPIRLPGA